MLSRISISKRLWLLISIIVTIFVVTFYYYFNVTVEKQFKEGFLKKGVSLIQTAAFNIGPALYFNDTRLLHNILKGLENDPDVSFVLINNKLGTTIYQSGIVQDTRLIETFLNEGSIHHYFDNYLMVKQSIFFRDSYQGEIIVAFNLDWIFANIQEQKKILIVISLILALILFFLVSVIANTISKPLRNAAETIKYYADKDGTLELRLPVKGNDEIAKLATAFNHLADNLDANILELNRSKKYLETLFQLNPIPILIADTLGHIEEVNEIASSFFGIEHDLLIQMNLENFINQEDLQKMLNKIIENREDIRNYVTTLKMSEGPKKVVELNIAANIDESDLVKNVIVTTIDITEKIQIQREILHNQTKLQNINSELTQKTEELENLSDLNKKNANNLARLIDISQQMMRSVDSNEIMKTMMESSVSLLESNSSIIFIIDNNKKILKPVLSVPRNLLNRLPEEIPESRNFIWRTYRENEATVLDSQKLQIDDLKSLGLNSQNIFSIVAVPVSEKDYHFGVIVFMRERKYQFRVEEVHLLSTLATQTAILLDNKNLVNALEEKAHSLENAYGELQRSQQQVIQLQKMESLGTLVGGIAHDFNNILGIILPNTDLIKNEVTKNPSVLRRIKIIADATQRAADLTRQLLMFSRNQDIQLEIISPNELVSRLSDMFQRTLGKEFEIRLQLESDVKNIEADENRLTQVLINLALNARDSMPNGGDITIRTRMSRYKNNSKTGMNSQEYVCISMTDSGCGIKASDLDKIFDPFFTTKSVGKGTGLGLSVVYGIMQSHKGFVEVESELNEGTTFYLYFPPAREKSLVEISTDVSKLPKGNEVILIVDDEKMIRESVKDILESLGYKVIQASSGSDAIQVVQKSKNGIRIAIVDMSMPKMGGIETIRKIREFDKNVKILLSSGHLEKEKLIPDDLNLEGILPKPYSMSELAYKIRQILE